MKLTEFLRARIAEDADEASHGSGGLLDHEDAYFTRARVLADCEAKRRIVERHANSGFDGCYICAEAERDDVLCVEQRILAAVYADHPDYREEWRP